MEFILSAATVINPATGTSIPVWAFIVSGVVVAGCIVFAVLSKINKDKNGKKRKK